MKESTKQRKLIEQYAELMGISIEEVDEMRKKSATNDHIREAEAVLIFLEHPDAFITKICSECRRSFVTTYKYVSNCSITCQIKALSKIGIDWNPVRSADERWRRAKIPVHYTVSPDALAVLIDIAKSNTASQESLVSELPSEDFELDPDDELLFELDQF